MYLESTNKTSQSHIMKQRQKKKKKKNETKAKKMLFWLNSFHRKLLFPHTNNIIFRFPLLFFFINCDVMQNKSRSAMSMSEN
jgi:hypothetical protein